MQKMMAWASWKTLSVAQAAPRMEDRLRTMGEKEARGHALRVAMLFLPSSCRGGGVLSGWGPCRGC